MYRHGLQRCGGRPRVFGALVRILKRTRRGRFMQKAGFSPTTTFASKLGRSTPCLKIYGRGTVQNNPWRRDDRAPQGRAAGRQDRRAAAADPGHPRLFVFRRGLVTAVRDGHARDGGDTGLITQIVL